MTSAAPDDTAGLPFGSRPDLMPVPAILDGDLAVDETLAVLGDAAFGVVVIAGTPAGLASRQDLATAANTGTASLRDPAVSYPPALIVLETGNLRDWTASEAVSLLDLDEGVHGLVVTAEGGEPVGVLPIEAVTAYLAGGGFRPRSRQLGPTGDPGPGELPGWETVPRSGVRCARCGYARVYAFYDRTAQLGDCGNPAWPTHPYEPLRTR